MNEQSDTASRLIEAAVALFSQKGYDGTSVRALSTLADANLGAITYHFGSKETLYDAAFGSVIDPIREIVVDAVKQDETIRYNNWQVGVGANFHWRKKLWLNAEVGQLINRRIRATDATGVGVKGTPSQALYWQVGGKLQF